jgi:CRP-like cAMP-binding protein
VALPTADKLREIPLFSELPETALQHIAGIATDLECPPGTVLAQADEPGTGMFVIEEGTVVVEARGGVHIELDAGEFVGELSLLVPETNRIGRVRALTDVRCLAISREAFSELLEDEPTLAVAMLPVLARRLVAAMIPD